MENKRVLITGGNKGIGLATTKLFYEQGYNVVVVARDFRDFEFSNNEKVQTVTYDLSDVSGIKRLMEEIGPIDILINNAGIMNSLPYNAYPKAAEDRLMAIDLCAPIELIRCVTPQMIANNYGRIVNVSSIAGYIGHPDIWYGVAKAGLINATKSFAKLLASKGIVINCVAPSTTETDMLNVIPEDRKEFMKKSSYINRFARAKEVAETIFWLATSSPEYINGTCVDINNGIFPR